MTEKKTVDRKAQNKPTPGHPFGLSVSVKKREKGGESQRTGNEDGGEKEIRGARVGTDGEHNIELHVAWVKICLQKPQTKRSAEDSGVVFANPACGTIN